MPRERRKTKTQRRSLEQKKKYTLLILRGKKRRM
jgi:hypothetical protein